MSWQESSFLFGQPDDQAEPEARQQPRLSTSWTEPAGRYMRLGRRNSAGDAEVPLLGDGEPPQPSPAASPSTGGTGWPALRLSSVTTRRLNKLSSSWGAEGQQVR